MNPIDKLFSEKKKNILSVYFTAGFPQLNSTTEILSELEKRGVDLVEIGMPFSDPLADGPVIQESSRIALENGMSISILFDQFKDSKIQDSKLPKVLMGYLNPVIQFGMKKFLDECVKNNISGVILPDLPVEVYEEEYKSFFEKAGVYFIFLATPQTSETRLKKIAALSKSFVYLVSTASTTGKSRTFSDEQMVSLRKVREIIPEIPVLVGFGIHDFETRKAASESTNGVVVGTAFIKELTNEKNISKAINNLINKLSIGQTIGVK
ncbi:MAG: tryptophan synthase subunit alpha [Bacteroidetes bacterium]|nr:tryptophan synthase subunit alpha [Bacteroidota bacterium]